MYMEELIPLEGEDTASTTPGPVRTIPLGTTPVRSPFRRASTPWRRR